MGSDDKRSTGGRDGIATPVTRRDFLKVAGVGAAALGVGGGLSSVVAACGGSDTSEAEGGSGRTIKVGFVSPLTGPLAAFGECDTYCIERWKEAVKDGITTTDGETHPVEIIVRDSQSDANRAATVAGDLIANDGIDIMMTASTSDTVNPVADQAEAMGVPCFSTDSPWQNYVFARGGAPDKPFTYTYHAFWGVDTNAAVQLDIWSKIDTNKKIGLMCPNSADGLALADEKTGLPFFFKEAGYTVVDGGRYQDGTEDFTSEISKFKAAGCELVSGVMIPPDFVNFWKQCHQQGFRPKVVTMPKALLFPSVLESMGEIGYDLTCELWWSPVYPYKSSLSGESCQELADDWTKRTSKQWEQPLLHYILFEVVADVLKRATDIEDKETITKALQETDLETVAGKINFTAGGANNPVPNVAVTTMAGGQWVKGTDYPFEIVCVGNAVAPQVPIEADVKLISY